MSLPAAIHAWLRGTSPFAAGVELLGQVGCDDDALLFLLSLGETVVSREALTKALQEVHDKHLRDTLAAQAPPSPVVTKADIEREREQLVLSVQLDAYQDRQLSPEQQELRAQGKEALREMSYLRGRLEAMPSDEDRHRDALRIVELDLQAVRLFARLDAWLATGRDPGHGPPPRDLSEAELRLELRNIESYISRATRGRREVTPAKLKAWQDRRAEIQTKLDAIPS